MHLKYKSGSSWVDYNLVIYPVGAIYLGFSSTSPASLFGGTWTPITGRFLYCNAGTGTGGNNSHNHIYGIGGRDFWSLTSALQIYNGSSNSWITINTKANNETTAVNSAAAGTSKSLIQSWYHTTTNTTSASNMPSYQTVYAWRRTA